MGGESVCREVRCAFGTSDTSSDDRAPPYVREMVDWGAGPRAGQFLIMGGKAIAAMDGRFSVAIDDIRRIAIPSCDIE